MRNGQNGEKYCFKMEDERERSVATIKGKKCSILRMQFGSRMGWVECFYLIFSQEWELIFLKSTIQQQYLFSPEY